MLHDVDANESDHGVEAMLQCRHVVLHTAPHTASSIAFAYPRQ